MKSPFSQRPDDERASRTEEFIAAHARKAAGERAKELASEVRPTRPPGRTDSAGG